MKRFFPILFVLFSTSLVKAQEFNGGILLGGSFSQIDGDTFSGYNKSGVTGGFYVNRFFQEKLSAQFSLIYSEKGSYEDNDDINYKCKLQYMELPLTLRYYHYKKVDFEAGFSLGYLIKQSEYFDGYIDENTLPFHKFDLSSIFGMNYKFTEKLQLGFHLNYSLLIVRHFSENNSTMEKGQRNNTLSFYLAYQLTTWK